MKFPAQKRSDFFKLPSKLKLMLVNLGLSITPIFVYMPVKAAEQIYVVFGPLQFSLPIASLEVYAKEGKIDGKLAPYAKHVEPQQMEQLREVLLTPIDVTPVAIAQFLYSPQGEDILNRLGQIIQTKAGQPGFYAMRAALIKAAAYPEGLTLLNVLREFPTYGIKINSDRGFAEIEALSRQIRQTEMAIAAVNQESRKEASIQREVEYPSQIKPSFSILPDLRQPGGVGYTKEILTLTDFGRGRSFPVDFYLPQVNGTKLPLIVISHGLGSDRMTFAYLAQHLASYGFAVAVLEHPGSNAQQLQALTKGLASEVTPPTEFIDRPLDVKFLLDELTRSFGRQLNLTEVGVLGQSFGGYTTFALAGAGINFELLPADCAALNNSLNLSLLLQCRSLELPQIQYQLADSRIKAAIAINPIGSSIFGQSQMANIAIPLMIVSGSHDTIAPALPEQIKPFTWLTTPDKYLVLLNKGTHFSTLGQSDSAVELPPEVLGPDPTISQNYMKALSVAFFETYLVGELSYRRYLSADYGQFISEDPMPLSLVESLTGEQIIKK
ncbi:MAG TPA: hypothetical protein DEG17_00350 [Cyanobacteria bacterium UBA11149]|nr:hypothetical protein [Cyanobacteria bacterium UBA11367]HBE60148.1 hypothetical protein [Cyanobacteria bacterium UBA11366]HBS71220.1 hypothetical protein [Cyanobacteria bacterium UBA11153]HBW87370.1 hypothetical protein [Cyanobacteria bacterium UBA11149]HCA93162.1 hypothetical protein [Cyanobacteria bacterium UBA9226]